MLKTVAKATICKAVNKCDVMGFQPGQVGNPNGRPKGSRNKRTEELWNKLEARGDRDPADANRQGHQPTLATAARSSRAHGHASAPRASHRHNQAMSHTSATVEPSQLSPAVTLRRLAGVKASLASNSWRSHTCRGRGTKARDRVEGLGLRRALDIRPRPWVFRPRTGLLPWRYIAAGDVRPVATNGLESGRFRGVLLVLTGNMSDQLITVR